MERVIGYTESFFLSAMQFISECAAKRKEILDVAKDTADDTELPDIEALVEDKLFTGAKTFTPFLGDLRLLPFFLFLQGGDLAIDVFDTLWHGTFLSFGYYSSLSSF